MNSRSPGSKLNSGLGFIPKHDLRNGTRVQEVLKEILAEKVQRLRSNTRLRSCSARTPRLGAASSSYISFLTKMIDTKLTESFF